MTVDENDYTLVIGIDFGTTFSGCSYAYVQDGFMEVKDITYWQIGHSSKVPTQSLYKKNTKELLSWGYLAINKAKEPSNKDDLVNRVKLWLDRTIKHPPTLPNGLTPTDVISDYLKELNNYVVERLKWKDTSLEDASKFKYCLTVPIMWSEESKGIMRNAAIQAGIVKQDDSPEKLLIVEESEAAALWCEHTSPELNLQNGSRYMICDAGGDTVDLAVFEIDETSGTRNMREVTMGSGSSCGSTLLDYRMEELLKKRLSRFSNVDRYKVALMVQQFVDTVKPIFDNENDSLLDIPPGIEGIIPHVPGDGIKGDKLWISTTEMREEVFEPVVQQVLDMIEKQLVQLGDRNLDAMFIAGGFGQSPYLFGRIKDTFKDRVKSIVLTPKGDMAVMRGAVLFGLKPRVITQRILRRTYGIKFSIPPESDIKQDNNTSPNKDEFHVCVKKGEPIDEEIWIKKRISWSKADLPIISLYAYDGDDPIPQYGEPPELELVAMFDTQFPIETRKKKERPVLNLHMQFCLDKIRIKINVLDREFEYSPVEDITGEKETIRYAEISSHPDVEKRRHHVLKWLKKIKAEHIKRKQ
ncbi:hypothetical protein J3Q64DRAFT_1681560 [Phycomyces blakesleeanus]|uniref:Actin-like ATPase domain-containing protein n=2 Tax=Phycomyces blakesleeanus TaxID=4837 RepID=A0A163D7D0_PHYB8|nr:hypothetical protein PHYBLDRAFT_78555 [Phycomyces blakesleeanus NRRL 1555(-)]OAD69290.1 hypothetical protein PHYBLDRAFT_78555 [Phycomyces blakesleeanus NRRL 1555(-)]|eukprot:XP_018287330.1 hypothetical protein PHYBLDRAFT_78555 [Phycomyces blakesleeanus NRRL 1555(-)]